MSSSSVLQSCLDFNFFNTPPPPPLPLSPKYNNMKINDNNEEVYVHPILRSRRLKLSTKSLEMCTETLGSETGANCCEEIHFTSIPLPNECCKNWVTEKKRTKKRSSSDSFPPPLTSICDVQLKAHREGGRLVLKAESVSFCRTYFQAERSGGRLTLRPLQNRTRDEDEDEDEDVDVEETEETEEENNVMVRGEMGVKNKVSMTSGCKESENGRKGLVIWKPFCVAS